MKEYYRHVLLGIVMLGSLSSVGQDTVKVQFNIMLMDDSQSIEKGLEYPLFLTIHMVDSFGNIVDFKPNIDSKGVFMFLPIMGMKCLDVELVTRTKHLYFPSVSYHQIYGVQIWEFGEGNDRGSIKNERMREYALQLKGEGYYYLETRAIQRNGFGIMYYQFGEVDLVKKEGIPKCKRSFGNL